MNQCVNDNCCGSFTPCLDDEACNACLLDPTGAGCDTNALFTTYDTCENTNCPATICTTDIGNYNEFGDPMLECNGCLGDSCCTSMETCVGDGSEAAINLCIACLTDPSAASCTNDTISAAAEEFNTCQDTTCGTQCADE